MANGHGKFSSVLIYLVLLCITHNSEWKSCLREDLEVITGITTQSIYRDDFWPPLLVLERNYRRHLGYIWTSSRGHYFGRRVTRYPNSVSTFQLDRLFISWDVNLNPGPSTGKPSCHTCLRTIARNHRSLNCNLCALKYHIKCGKVTPKQFKQIQTNDPKTWICPSCLIQQPTQECDSNIDVLSSLPFASVTNIPSLFTAESALNNIPNQPCYGEEEGESHLADLVQQLELSSRKDLRMAHLNVCSLRNKIEELRCLQLLCKFEILAITETHLDKSISDTTINIDGMKFIRLDRKERKGGGCMLYYAEHLQATHRKDLFTKGLEAIWLQVKFPSTSVLFSVIYRPPDANQFFNLIGSPLEKAWLKTSNIVLLGDFNCNFASQDGISSPLNTNAEKLRSVFDMFNMQNVIMEDTRITLTSCSLIDLIVTTRKDLISSTGVFPLGISDHNLIFATIRLKNKRPPPKYIKTRDYKSLDVDKFRYDIQTAPFHIASVFDDADDTLWAWQKLYTDICDEHAPWKEVKIRSKSAPWITNDIRYKMNRRYKLFKTAITTKCPTSWQEYKKARNEVTSAIRETKASYFFKMFKEVKKTSAYWNLLNKATNPTVHKKIGPLKRDDGSLVLVDEEKAFRMNLYYGILKSKAF